MTYDPERGGRSSVVSQTKPMTERTSENGAWTAVPVITAVLVIVGHFYLRPDVPSPNMRAKETTPITVSPAPNSN